MKQLFTIALVLATVVATMARAGDNSSTTTNRSSTTMLSDDELGEMLQQAALLARLGRYDDAEARCKTILAQKPDEPTVKQLLREIEERRRRASGDDAARDFKQKLGELIVPAVNFREADPRAVIDYLRAESKKLMPDKSEINFVWLVPADVKLPRVTLSLQKIPLLDVVRYTTAAANLRYRVDAHAVVLYKEQPAPSPAPEPNVKPK
jgi:hypothetical protein